MPPTERRRFLAGLERRLTAQALTRREPERRYPILLTLLAQSAVDVLEEILTIACDPAISDEQVGTLPREGIGMARLRAARAETIPRDHGDLGMPAASDRYLREFTQDVLRAIGFDGGVAARPLRNQSQE
ncbi:hypothetical protein [Amycolatopsis decaplanina]|uniref:hypothetical protein n=1 Tax=Amycolatopsis decaplanina TaxID=208441 RepID=UPI00034D4720|nr:hypothetical protein [Amycolatopsis decaplanina]